MSHAKTPRTGPAHDPSASAKPSAEPAVPQPSLVLPPGYYEYYGLRPPNAAPGAVQMQRSPFHQGWQPPPGLRELYGVGPRTAPDTVTTGLVQRKHDGQAEPADLAEPAALIGAPATAEPAPEGGQEGVEDSSYGGVYRSVKQDDVSLVSDASKPKDTEVAKLKKGEVVQLVDLGAGEAFNSGEDTGKRWWKVKAMKGDAKGKEGWVKAALLDSVYNIKDKGTKNHSGKSGDGEVTVRTGLEVDTFGKPLGNNMFSLRYEGKDADQARWLQFVWREVIGVDTKGASSPVTGSITTTGGTYQLTEGGTKDAAGAPKKENYNTDSADKSDPFYESKGAADRTADSTAMFDQPAPAVSKVQDAFAGGARSVISRAHFSTFLVKERKVSYQSHIDVHWDFGKSEDTKKPPKGAHAVSGSGEAAALPDTIRERFHEQYPTHKDIK